ncbi:MULTISPECIES: DUF2510 domain-containing protein [Gordonia]|uniref:DUF2510 domain-containing protein n=1 Tax=Gordonia TaxID=2053 RepID=UPI0035E45793
MGAISWFHWLILLVVLLLVVGVPAIVVVLVVKSTRSRRTISQIPNAAFQPGWYAAPDNPALLRWYDGAQWTPHTRPRSD